MTTRGEEVAATRPRSWTSLAAVLLALMAPWLLAPAAAGDPPVPAAPVPEASAPAGAPAGEIPGAEAFPAAGGPTIGVDEIHRGQRGFGVSVFRGSRLERFEVEVLGVLRNAKPGSTAIMARLSGQGLEDSGVIAGMSGSPVYIDGRLAGAVAFGWNFSKEPIAGITPIADMHDLRGLAGGGPGGAARVSSLEPPVPLAQWIAGDLPADLLEKSLERLAPRAADGASSGLQWTLSGFGETTRSLFSAALGGATVGGGGVEEGPAPEGAASTLEPGSPVAAVLVRGDLALAATGTVTDRVGDDVLAFGHPFLDFGPVDLPMASADVITVVPSLANSFKLTNLGPVVGAIHQDREVGVFGRLGDQARMIPLTVRLGGEGLYGQREFHMEVAQLPQITPTLLAVATLGCLESSGHREGEQGLDLQATLRIKGHGEIRVAQTFDGIGIGVQAAVYVLSLAGTATQTPFEDVELESVEVELTRSPEVRLANLVGAYADRNVVRPGETVGVQVELLRHGGTRSRQALEVEIPEDLDEGAYYLLIGDGISADGARVQLEPAVPTDYPQLLALLRSLHSRRDLVVLGLVQDPGLVVGGDALPRLPGSVRSLWRSATTTGAASPIPLAIARRQTEASDLPLEGIVRVDLEVRRP
ncbi:MAG: hypothetical protein KDD11_07175 [Acidobacteria bacterium]|nr:hypothetical protein [Acidobacteriota bacterium]